jgi:hypothetical protein
MFGMGMEQSMANVLSKLIAPRSDHSLRTGAILAI